jgi:hypothetical protein
MTGDDRPSSYKRQADPNSEKERIEIRAARTQPARSGMRRWRVIVPCIVVGFLPVSLCAIGMGGHTLLFVAPMTGPFAEPLVLSDHNWGRMLANGCPALAAIAAHPAWPRWYTACITILAMAWWVLIGLSYTYVSV